MLFLPQLLPAQITDIKTLGDPCTTRTLSLQVVGASSSPYFTWNFGDPASGKNDTVTISGGTDVPFPVHTFSAPGPYNVCVTFQEPGFPETTLCKKIFIGLCCEGVMESTDGCLENNIFFSVLTGAPITTLNWDFGDPASGSFNTSNRLEPDHRFSAPGTYTVTVTLTAPCSTFVVSKQFTIESCEPEDTCNALITARDSCVASGTLFQLRAASGILTALWDFGDPSSGADNNSTLLAPVHRYNTPGLYQVKAFLNLNCGPDTALFTLQVVDCEIPPSPDCRLIVPNAFSPNDDGRNDLFRARVYGTCELEQFEMHVFDRWGQLVFKSTDLSRGWNGRIRSNAIQTGGFAYIIRYRFRGQRKQVSSGQLVLVR